VFAVYPVRVAESIWTRPARGARGPEPEYSRERIAAEAVALADEGGLGAVSMRAVAGRLGTAAGSLYRYLSARSDLLALMVDAAVGETTGARRTGADWLEDMVAVAHEQLALFRRHPWLVDALAQAPAPGPRTLDHFDRCLEILAPVDRDTAAKLEAVAMVTGLVSLFTRAQAAPPAAYPFAALDPDAHRHLAAALAGAAPAGARPDLFDRTVRGLLTGLLA
jgi:AcrR family transcriptional regulator